MDSNLDVYDHVTKVIRYHPKYFEHYIKTHRYLMYDDGPLPYATRHYLAIIAAARNKCNYLVNLHEKEFIAEGGDVKWLNGLEFIPPKLRAIYDINKILAHRPWLLTKEHIERLTKGTNSWSLAEVVHAIVILAHFHSLSSFVFSCGLNQELDASLKNGALESSVASSTVVEAEPEIKPSTTPPFVQRLKLEQQRIHHQHHQMMKEQEENRKILQMNNNQNVSNGNSNGASCDNIEMLMKRMQDLTEKRKECCSETELSNRFKNVELQVRIGFLIKTNCACLTLFFFCNRLHNSLHQLINHLLKCLRPLVIMSMIPTTHIKTLLVVVLKIFHTRSAFRITHGTITVTLL